MAFEVSNDKGIIQYGGLVQKFGTSSPAGTAQVNSVKTPRVSCSSIYCTGDVFVFGAIKTLLQLEKGIAFGDGFLGSPSISFVNDPTTGFYLAGPGQVGVSSGSDPALLFGNGTISTSSGDLILDPAGTNIDFAGHTIINAVVPPASVGNPNEVIINNGLGVMTSELRLATVRGGTGVDSSASTGFAKVSGGAWTFSAINNSDLSGVTALTVTTLTAAQILSVGDLAITPGSTVLNLNAVVHQPAVGIVAAGDAVSYVTNVQTTNATPTALCVIPTATGRVYALNVTVSMGIVGGSASGMFSFVAKGRNIGGTATVGTRVQLVSILDAGLENVTATLDISGTNIRVMATGIAATTINWVCKTEVVMQSF